MTTRRDIFTVSSLKNTGRHTWSPFGQSRGWRDVTAVRSAVVIFLVGRHCYAARDKRDGKIRGKFRVENTRKRELVKVSKNTHGQRHRDLCRYRVYVVHCCDSNLCTYSIYIYTRKFIRTNTRARRRTTTDLSRITATTGYTHRGTNAHARRWQNGFHVAGEPHRRRYSCAPLSAAVAQ